mgnify:CR=1 FL=1
MKTLLKITGGLIGGIFILLLVALIAVNTDFVQNKALQYVTRILTEKLQMPTKAKHININILYEFNDDSFENAILKLHGDEALRKELGAYNVDYVKNFSIGHSLAQMAEIYREFM